MFLLLLGIYVRVKLLVQDNSVQRVTFKELTNCFPKQLPYFTLPKAVCESLDFSNILVNICLADFLSLFFLLGVK